MNNNNNNNNSNNNNNRTYLIDKQCLLLKSSLQLSHLKLLFRQNAIYNSLRLKKTLSFD